MRAVPKLRCSTATLTVLALIALTCWIFLVAATAKGSGGSVGIGSGQSFLAPGHAGAIDFNRQIGPVLSNRCFKCHGPDAQSREAELRLDQSESATAPRKDGGFAIVPGDPDASLLIQRISSDDPKFRMPPVKAGPALSAQEIETFRAWVAQGAHYARHWSFVAPTRPDAPIVSDPDWVRNAIDAFILHRLDENGMTHSPEADKARLLRRVTLDLTGLPPTIDQQDAFLDDTSEGAYEKVVDRLLASPAYGEHMARYWLDAARYGDTHGLHLDNYRAMWRWRDWVIEAFNRNMPFDEFTIEQLAGDELPDPTQAQLIATGFNRNNVSTSEGGAIPEEYLVKYAVDRVETTSTVFMGLTAGCAVCHDHKFDPLTQKEFYQLFAFFGNITENGMDGNVSNPPPAITAPTPVQQKELDALRERIAGLESTLNAPDPVVDDAQARWEQAQRSAVEQWWSPVTIQQATSTAGSTLTLQDDQSILATGANPARDDYVIVASTDATDISLVRLEALTDESLVGGGPGRANNGNFVLSEFEMVAVSRADPTQSRAVHFNHALADFSQTNGDFLVPTAIDGSVSKQDSGWAVAGYDRHEPRTAVFVADEPFGFEGGTQLRFVLRFESQYDQHAIGRFRLAVSNSDDLHGQLAPLALSDWDQAGPFATSTTDQAQTVAAAFGAENDPGRFDPDATFSDGAIKWVRRSEYADGQINTLSMAQYSTMYLHRTITSPNRRSATISLGSDDAFALWINGTEVARSDAARPPAPDQNLLPVELEPGDNDVMLKVVNFAGGFAFYFKLVDDDSYFNDTLAMSALAVAPDQRTPQQAEALRSLFRREYSPQMRSAMEALDAVRREETKLVASLPTTLIMQERDMPSLAHVLNRGNYDQPLDEVQPDVPAFLPPLPEGQSHSRLTLARWLVNGQHPLTARVTVNRLWQQVFGTGIVRTSEDFGAQGAPPTHPELLDWLAVEFTDSGWNVKHMMKLMVMSATYRQSSRITDGQLQRDPQNQYYGHGPRFRLDAEEIRDLALASSGLLDRTIGGPSVRPYQPPGIWKAVAYPDSDTRIYMPDTGTATHRRSLYTFWKRTSPPPNLLTFDAPSREVCTVRRPRTDTPLQMLVLMNDPQFVEASVALADRVLQSTDSHHDRITLAFRLVLSRDPEPDELETLRKLLGSSIDKYSADTESAAALVNVGAYQPSMPVDPVQLAAWTTLTSTILSLDEAITKG